MSDGIDPKATGLENPIKLVNMQPATAGTHVESVLPPATANLWARIGSVGVVLLTIVVPQLGLTGIPLIAVAGILGLVTIACLLLSAKRVTPEIVETGKMLYNTIAPAVVDEIAKRKGGSK